jgi:DNA uptake protein ComE-like DNA-binding protein
LFSLFAIALLAGVRAAQTAPAQKRQIGKDELRYGAPADADLLDINSATKEYTARCPASRSHSQKIIDGRPYAKKTDLTRKKIISAATYAKIKDKIIAKQK